MRNLIEKLEKNTLASESLDKRHYETLTGAYWNLYKTDEQRTNELIWITKIQKRVLRMRFRILENIQMEITKEMHFVSSQSRQKNLSDYSKFKNVA